jgi:membrane-associated phospholipid phosphatase
LLRIALGFHWPSDMVAGVLLGLLGACMIVFTMPYYLRITQSFNRRAQRYPAIFHVLLFSFLYDFSQKFSSLFAVLHYMKQMVGA